MCRNRCDYCGFVRDPDAGAWFMSHQEVLELARRAKSAGCSEALLTLGELPEVHLEARKKLESFGYKNTVDYLVDLCKQIMEIGLLPHTNAGVLNENELRRLRRYNASMGLMLENAVELPVHLRSPGKDPKLRIETIKAAGKLRIPFTTGLLVGIGETFEDLVKSLVVIRGLHEQYSHIQEVIIQPFEPRPSTPMGDRQRPSEAEVFNIVAFARSIMPGMNIQVPPNLLSHDGEIAKPGSSEFEKAVAATISAGANDFGGISSVTPDFINPDNPWPSVAALRAAIEHAEFSPRERLPIYPQFINDGKFMSKEVKELVDELADDDGYRAN